MFRASLVRGGDVADADADKIGIEGMKNAWTSIITKEYYVRRLIGNEIGQQQASEWQVRINNALGALLPTLTILPMFEAPPKAKPHQSPFNRTRRHIITAFRAELLNPGAFISVGTTAEHSSDQRLHCRGTSSPSSKAQSAGPGVLKKTPYPRVFQQAAM